MSDILSRILETKREEVAELLRRRTLEALRRRAVASPAPRDFLARLAHPGAPHLIAEVKKASPSKGILRADFDPVAIAKAYEAAGAACLSVLTDRQYFQGSTSYVAAIRGAVSLPILRKDFIIHEAQVCEARMIGADAILLIAAALEPADLARLHDAAGSLQMAVLVEIHDEDDLARVRASGVRPALLGINNRDLRTFRVDLETTKRLAAQVDWPTLLVAESGIFTPADIRCVADAGARAVLVGESLVREPDIAAATRRLLAPS